MAIKIDGKVPVPAPREQVWNSLFDAPTLARIAGKVPGVVIERFERTSQTEYEGTALVSVAMVKGRYDGRIEVVEQRPCEYVKLHAQGMGGGNRASGDIVLNLAQDRPGSTRLDYQAIGNLTGPLANLGQRLVDSVGRQFIEQGVQAMSVELAGQGSAAGASEPLPVRRFPAWAIPAAIGVGLVLLAVLAYAALAR